MKEGAPVRFLILLVGGWTCLRVATLSTGWWADAAERDEVPRPSPPARQVGAEPMTTAATSPIDRAKAILSAIATASARPTPRPVHVEPPEPPPLRMSAPILPPALPARRPMEAPRSAQAWPEAPPGAAPPPQIALASAGRVGRWSGSAWLLARRDSEATLAPGGTLGGSQVGARLLYRLNGDASRPLAITARAYAPLRRAAEAEAAIGIDWRPSVRLPIHLLIERRQQLGRAGRSAFAATAYGGVSADLGAQWRLDGYAQAGIVGARSRDAFLDGSGRLSRRAGPIEAGVAFWGAAQPGATRLDVGPHLSVPIRAHGASFRLSADYRFRIGGDARPSSGPALTFGVDF